MKTFTRPDIKHLLESNLHETPGATGFELNTAETNEFFEQLSVLLYEGNVSYDGNRYYYRGIPLILAANLLAG